MPPSVTLSAARPSVFCAVDGRGPDGVAATILSIVTVVVLPVLMVES